MTHTTEVYRPQRTHMDSIQEMGLQSGTDHGRWSSLFLVISWQVVFVALVPSAWPPQPGQLGGIGNPPELNTQDRTGQPTGTGSP